jgi:hypothetical protein
VGIDTLSFHARTNGESPGKVAGCCYFPVSFAANAACSGEARPWRRIESSRLRSRRSNASASSHKPGKTSERISLRTRVPFLLWRGHVDNASDQLGAHIRRHGQVALVERFLVKPVAVLQRR